MNNIYTILVIALLLLGIVSVTYINISSCKIIQSGMFAGRKVCYFGQVTVSPGNVTTLEVNITK